tara:strand:+ start:43 stop:693 length:651 start_codon:yes stop_codon:yes gene_type:complete
MSLFKKEQGDLKVVRPPVLGWLEKKLSDKEMDYLWRCIDNHKKSIKSTLIGQIHESNDLIDKSDWFFNNTLKPLCRIYSKEFNNIGNSIPVKQSHPYYLQSFWVNYQKQNEFNPLHNHNGVYSFVIWMKIPTKHNEQNNNPISSRANAHLISAFQFSYQDIIGGYRTRTYKMNPEIEGTMLFFPAKLQHCVHPFYNCDEDRISISGNISLNTAKLL